MILSSLFGRREGLARKGPSYPVSEMPGVLFGTAQSSAGVEVTEETALSLSAVFAGVSLLSRILATLPLKVYRAQGGRREPAVDHPAYRVLAKQANPEMTAVIARRTMEFQRLLWGNSYGEIGWAGTGQVAAVWPVEPWRVKERRLDDGSLVFRVDGHRDVAPGDMIHHTLISADGIRGQGFVDYASESLGLGLAAQEYAARYFGNGARPGAILEHPSPQQPEKVKEFRRQWNERHGGSAKAGGTAVLHGGWQYKTDGSHDPEKQQLIEQRRFSIEDVARWLNIPPHLLRDLTRSTNNNIEHQGIDFVIYSIGPTLVEQEAEYDAKLLAGDDSLYAKHNVAGLLRGDSKARGEFYRALFNVGSIAPNEIRELEEMNPQEGGDEPFVPINMQPLSRAMKEPAAPPPSPSPFPPDGPAPGDNGPQDDAPAPGLSPARVAEAMRSVLAATLARMAKVEANAVKRLAEKPGEFLAGVEALLAKHGPTLAEAVAPVLDAARPLCPEMRGGAPHLAAFWIEGTRQALLGVAERARPATLAGLVAEWAAGHCDGGPMARHWIGGAA